jgi:hypothetical protein
MELISSWEATSLLAIQELSNFYIISKKMYSTLIFCCNLFCKSL